MKIIKPLLRHSKIAIVGEMPDPISLQQNAPFSGSSGRILDKALKFANIDRDLCTLTYVNKSTNPSNMDQWMNQLRVELSSYRPNVAIALGEDALKALTGRAGITLYRGSILPSFLVPGLKVVPALAPAWILRGQFQHFWSLVNDLTRAEKQSKFSDIRPRPWISRTSPSFKDAKDFIEGIPNDAKWCLDIETRSGHVACFSIASGNTAMCFPIQNPGGSYFFPSTEGELWRLTAELMKRNPFLVGQNLTFDLEYLFDYGLEPSGIFMDTMISHAILYPEFPKGLDFLCAMYTEMQYYKSEGKVSNPNTDTRALHEYNNKDTMCTLWCAEEIEKQLKSRGLWPVHEFVTKELGLALEMQRNRMLVDNEKRSELKLLVEQAGAEIGAKWAEKYDETLAKLAGDRVSKPNVNSPKQVSEFLYGHLKLPKKTRQGVVVADETAISELKAAHPKIPELGWILEERHLRKLNSSYLDVELEQDGTLPGSWCVHGTETGRWSSGKSPRSKGLNLQTVPKAVRWMVVPPTREAA